jgi:hypothetical protein
MTKPSTAILACGNCAAWDHSTHRIGLCRAHAPAPAEEADAVAHWPETSVQDGCGDGAGITGFIRCRDCAYWHQPNPGEGLKPVDRRDVGQDWWAEAGHCRRHAPLPRSVPGHHGFWRVTHAGDGCADGKA